MGQMKYILFLALLTLSFLTGALQGTLSSELYPALAGAADKDTAEDEQCPAPAAPCYLLRKEVPKRRVDWSALPFVVRSPILPPPRQAFRGFYPSSAASVCAAAPLYQALQVYRL
jgi:hypothetical protein